jgi:hypothetical protein
LKSHVGNGLVLFRVGYGQFSFKQENQQLRELLRECRDEFERLLTVEDEGDNDIINDLLEKLDNQLEVEDE